MVVLIAGRLLRKYAVSTTVTISENRAFATTAADPSSPFHRVLSRLPFVSRSCKRVMKWYCASRLAICWFSRIAWM